MKKKVFDKKLNLKKETVATLFSSQMNKVKGGGQTLIVDCGKTLVPECSKEAWVCAKTIGC